jgi:hypothetical protein
MEVGVSLANTMDMRLGALDASGMPLAVVDFGIFLRNEFLDSIYVSQRFEQPPLSYCHLLEEGQEMGRS